MRATLAPVNHHLITDDRVEAVHRPLHAADSHHSILQTARRWDAGRIERDAHLIDQPTLIVWGEEDAVIPIRNGEKLQEEILHSRFVVFQNCGHVPQEEKAEDFVDVVSRFCRDRKGRIAEAVL
jgi:pimeloyl-ACP methyl ester carboxylesterase